MVSSKTVAQIYLGILPLFDRVELQPGNAGRKRVMTLDKRSSVRVEPGTYVWYALNHMVNHLVKMHTTNNFGR